MTPPQIDDLEKNEWEMRRVIESEGGEEIYKTTIIIIIVVVVKGEPR